MRAKLLLAVPIVLAAAYVMGPNPTTPSYSKILPELPAKAQALENYVSKKESMHKLKPDNQARIIWYNDSLKQKTAYSIVYLHGFSASQAEGEPVHRNIAKLFGCNLYLARLAEHGIDTTNALINLNTDSYWESAKEAYAIGKQLGNKVILMGTSTGGSLALLLAAEFPEVDALILLSPNIAINDPNAWLLNNPWGLQVARAVLHSDFVESKDKRDVYKQYWNSKYRIEAAVQLEELIETSMMESTFKKIHQPVLTLYYYRDAIHQDSTVKVSAMKEMMEQLGTPDNMKRSVSVPKAGNHVIGSYIRSNDLEGVQKEIEKFLIEKLHLRHA